MIFHHRTTHFLHSTPLLKRMANPESEWGPLLEFFYGNNFWMLQIWFGYFHFPFLSMWKDHNCHLCGERVEMGPLLTKRNTTSNMAKATSSTSTALLSLSITQYLKNQGQTYYVIKLSYFPRFRTNNVPCTVAIFLSFVQLSCPSNGLQLFFLTFKTETTS